jgi:hypothetical protein
VSALATHPELLRNCRIQLRRGRLLATAAICAAVSLSFVAVNRSSTSDIRQMFTMIFLLQAVALVIGGSIYCLQSVQREKDQNTFDFQRITRLTPLQLAVGKVLGAPALMYFALLCMMPVALWAAFLGGVNLLTVVEIYVLLLLGAFTFHCFAVLISMVLEKGTSAGALFFFLWALGFSSIDPNSGGDQTFFAIHSIGPFWPYNLVPEVASTNPFLRSLPPPPASPYVTGPTTDLFFGVPIPHAGVLIVLYLSLAAWFLLALARNIKRDPSVYEIFRPVQAFGFALYLSFLFLGFCRWVELTLNSQGQGPNQRWVWQSHSVTATEVETAFLVFNLVVFFALGLTLLRNRERARRFLREFGGSAAGWVAALWPAPYLVAGILLCGGAMLFMIHAKDAPQSGWSLGVGFLQVCFAAAWVARDFIYLQWMNVRRVRRPLISGALFMVVYYTCMGVVLSTLYLFQQKSSIAAVFIPSAVFGLDSLTWSAQQSKWIGALLLLLAQVLLFAWLQRRELKQLGAMNPAAEPAIP